MHTKTSHDQSKSHDFGTYIPWHTLKQRYAQGLCYHSFRSKIITNRCCRWANNEFNLPQYRMLLPYWEVQKKGIVLISSFRPSMLRAAVRPEYKPNTVHNMKVPDRSEQSRKYVLSNQQLKNYVFFFYKNVVFPAQAEYCYFSADFRLKIFLYYS